MRKDVAALHAGASASGNPHSHTPPPAHAYHAEQLMDNHKPAAALDNVAQQGQELVGADGNVLRPAARGQERRAGEDGAGEGKGGSGATVVETRSDG